LIRGVLESGDEKPTAIYCKDTVHKLVDGVETISSSAEHIRYYNHIIIGANEVIGANYTVTTPFLKPLLIF
jgi:hypothetical protein